MAYTYNDLHKKTVAELRQVAQGLEHEAVQGFTQMNKEHLLPAICKALGIDAREHHHAIGAKKTALKSEIHKLKADRAKAIEAHDKKKLKTVRHRIHKLKRSLRSSMV